jgi:hypothetical protein
MLTVGTPSTLLMPPTTQPLLPTPLPPSPLLSLCPQSLNQALPSLPTTWTHPPTPPCPILPLTLLNDTVSALATSASTTTMLKSTATSPSNVITAGTRRVGSGSPGAWSAHRKPTRWTRTKDGSTTSWPASTVGGLTSVDLTSHVTTANLEMLAAVSSANMLVSSRVDQWLSGISQSEEGVVLHSESTSTFSPSSYTYSTPKTWDTPLPSPTVVSEFPNVVPAHPFDILPCLAPEHFNLGSLMQPWPYDTHHFTTFCLYYTDTDDRKLRLTARPHVTHMYTLKHETFCLKRVCPTHYPYGNNKCAK